MEETLDKMASPSEGSDFGDEGGEELWLEEFRSRLVPGMPVHMDEVLGRHDLNGTAGFLKGWDGYRELWKVDVNGTTVLVRTDNIFP